MFSTAGKQSIALDNFGGLVTQAPPESLPEGASPLTWDADFPIAAVQTRPGLRTQLNAGAARNFTWLKSMRRFDGTIRTLCLDSSGQLWQENVTANPTVLTPLKTFTPGDAANGTNAFNREYICLSDPGGLVPDTPWQYDGTNFDRISQEGPGANGLSITPASNPNSATITSFAITSNVATFQAVNTFSAGTITQITGMQIGTYLNGLVLTVLGAGLSGTQFEANVVVNPDVPSTTDTGTASVVTAFGIAAITQPTQKSIGDGGTGPSGGANEWASGPRSKTAGTTITVYYSFNTPADADIVNAFTKGIPIYVYVTGQPAPFQAGTYQINSVGVSPDGSRNWNFFSYTAPYANFNIKSGVGHYQVSLATVQTTTPVPGLAIGSQVSVQGATPSTWNNTWSVLDTQQSGVLNINQTTMVPGVMPQGGIATYAFTLISGNAPVPGDLLTVSNTTNGNGVFNVVNATIATVVGSTFTVNGFAPQTIAAQAETGGAQTFGDYFSIDPGPQFVGLPSAQTPIFGNDTAAGTVTALGSTLNIGGGTRQMVVLFQTRNNGYLTKASPPVTFTTTGLQQSITVSNIPIGPPNVSARWIAFTEAGANEVPGAFFYVIPIPVQSIVNGQPYTYSSTVVQDNTSTTASFTFTDAVLLASTEIDVPGNDLFSIRELGNCRWTIQYANRMFYGLEQNKVNNFNNLTFNGGYQSGNLFPLGWTADVTNGSGGALVVSSIGLGNSYNIQNTTGSTKALLGMITQGAFQDAYGVSILLPNTQYGIRALARVSSLGLGGNMTGNLVAEFISYDSRSGYGTSYGLASIPFASFGTTMSWVNVGNILTTPLPATIPQNIVLRLYAAGIANNVGLEVDRIEFYDMAQPVLSTQVAASYVGQPEAIDSVTGKVGLAQKNMQPANGAFVMYDQLYFLKSSSMFVTQDSSGDEPGLWDVHEVSNRVGTASIWSYDVGEEWMVTACREGAFVFTGGSPVKVSQEIQQAWDLINWNAAYSMWTKVDIQNKRILIGAPMATPNAYLPNAPVNANPTSPNVLFVLNYVGLGSPMALADSPQMHDTMFGTLVSTDMRRKWNLWQIKSPYAEFILRGDGLSNPLFLCNGTASGKIYDLDPVGLSDDGTAINGTYTTYGFVNSGMAKQNPLLGFHRKLYTYFQLLAYGSGTLAVKFLANRLNADAQHQWNVLSTTGGINLQANPQDDIERSINITGNRVFVQVSTNAVGARFTMSKMIVCGGPSPMLPLRGSASA